MEEEGGVKLGENQRVRDGVGWIEVKRITIFIFRRNIVEFIGYRAWSQSLQTHLRKLATKS